jgi:hypothetical protein
VPSPRGTELGPAAAVPSPTPLADVGRPALPIATALDRPGALLAPAARASRTPAAAGATTVARPRAARQALPELLPSEVRSARS